MVVAIYRASGWRFVELASYLIVMGIFINVGQHMGRTWTRWIASTSFLSNPFYFNWLLVKAKCVAILIFTGKLDPLLMLLLFPLR